MVCSLVVVQPFLFFKFKSVLSFKLVLLFTTCLRTQRSLAPSSKVSPGTHPVPSPSPKQTDSLLVAQLSIKCTFQFGLDWSQHSHYFQPLFFPLQFLSHSFSPLTSNHVWFDSISNCSALKFALHSVLNKKRKRKKKKCAAQSDENTNLPYFGSGDCFVTNRNNKVARMRKLY